MRHVRGDSGLTFDQQDMLHRNIDVSLSIFQHEPFGIVLFEGAAHAGCGSIEGAGLRRNRQIICGAQRLAVKLDDAIFPGQFLQ